MSLRIIDRTARTPAGYRVRERAPSEVDLVCLHQTGTGPLSEEAADRVKAHAVVLDDGAVLQLHPWLARLKYGSGPWNGRGITVEHRANLPGRYQGDAPRWAGKAPRETWDADARRAQVVAARGLLARLRAELPGLRYVGAHRQIDSPRKGGCPGADLWREVGEWAIRELGLELVASLPSGADLPAGWRRAPTVASPGAPRAAEAGREAAEGEGTSRAYAGPLEPSPFVLGGTP